MNKAVKVKLFWLTPIFILLAHYLAVFPHEFSHSFMAWALGYKNNPLLLNFGGTSLLNLLILFHIDENVNYKMIFDAGHPGAVALIAFAGPGLANGLLYILSLWLLAKKKIQQSPYLFYFLFFFNFFNLANFYDYIPIRTFSPQGYGDAGHFELGLGLSPWWVYIIGGYLVAFLIWHFFTKTMISAYVNLDIRSVAMRASLMVILVLMLFGYFGMPGLSPYYGPISFFLSATSLLAIPGIIIAMWPTRNWVTSAIKNYPK